MSLRNTYAAAALASLLLTAARVVDAAPLPAEPNIAAAIADPTRGNMGAVDARRHIAEVMRFSGVKPGDRIVDLIPGSGYFTRVFARIAGARGHVYMIWPNEYANVAHPDPENSIKLSREPGYSNLSVIQQPAAAFATPEPVDLVFTAQNYHDYPDKFMGFVDPVAFGRAVYRALKPGGTFLIIDHVAQSGSAMRDIERLHRIDPATVKAQLLSVGFTFAGESAALRNPADDHTRIVFDPAIRGRTDQFIYKFRKPF